MQPIRTLVLPALVSLCGGCVLLGQNESVDADSSDGSDGSGDESSGDSGGDAPVDSGYGATAVDPGGCGATLGDTSDDPTLPACGSGALCVDASAAAGSPDGSAGAPYPTISAALEAASDGDAIHVAAGTYNENLQIEAAIVLRGGFAAGGDFSSRDPAAQATCIAGDGSDSVITADTAGDLVIDGFNISGGSANQAAFDNAEVSQGAGIWIFNDPYTIASVDILIRNNVIENNTTGGDIDASAGGGIFVEADGVRIENNLIRSNRGGRGAGIAAIGANITIGRNSIIDNIGEGDHGGGVWASGADMLIRNNHVEGNATGNTAGYGWGGGIIFFDLGTEQTATATVTLTGNLVRDNFAPSAGGGVFIDDGATAVLRNELIVDNRCDGEDDVPGGAGIYVDGQGYGPDNPSSAEIVNVTVVGNRCSQAANANGIFVEQRSSVTVVDSIFWDNAGDFGTQSGGSIDVSYSLTGDTTPGTGNISGDPSFAGSGDYHLRSEAGRFDPAAGEWVTDSETSIAIDAGRPSASADDEPTPNGGRVNLGAFGNTQQASKSDA